MVQLRISPFLGGVARRHVVSVKRCYPVAVPLALSIRARGLIASKVNSPP